MISIDVAESHGCDTHGSATSQGKDQRISGFAAGTDDHQTASESVVRPHHCQKAIGASESSPWWKGASNGYATVSVLRIAEVNDSEAVKVTSAEMERSAASLVRNEYLHIPSCYQEHSCSMQAHVSSFSKGLRGCAYIFAVFDSMCALTFAWVSSVRLHVVLL